MKIAYDSEGENTHTIFDMWVQERSGKEYFIDIIHYTSKSRSLVIVNCGFVYIHLNSFNIFYDTRNMKLPVDLAKLLFTCL
ncbi:hypothetical protein COD67_08270 [Bacillus cereus]|nr:hypothetical protein COI89_06845 [Bacillus cereus]PGU67947.1 hypothetical protein COD67_08270 [Bacillus cereus]